MAVGKNDSFASMGRDWRCACRSSSWPRSSFHSCWGRFVGEKHSRSHYVRRAKTVQLEAYLSKCFAWLLSIQIFYIWIQRPYRSPTSICGFHCIAKGRRSLWHNRYGIEGNLQPGRSSEFCTPIYTWEIRRVRFFHVISFHHARWSSNRLVPTINIAF